MHNTAKITDRRTLRFANLAEVIADAEKIAASERAGTLRRTGNWSVGQNFNHIAGFMEYAYDGYPAGLGNPPAIIRWILKFQKNKYVHGGMPAGVYIPKVTNGTVGQEDGPTDQALARLRRAAERMQKTAPTQPNAIFGPMTHDEWMQMNCRHAELHFSFLHPV